MPHHTRDEPQRANGSGAHGEHGWLTMLLCCIPMVAIILLILFGILKW